MVAHGQVLLTVEGATCHTVAIPSHMARVQVDHVVDEYNEVVVPIPVKRMSLS